MWPGLLHGMLSMIGLDLRGCEHLFHRLPHIVSDGIPSPFDEVLEFAHSTKMTVPQNVLNLEFFFPVHKV